MLVGEGRAPRGSGAPPDSAQVDRVPLEAIPATYAAEEEAQVDSTRLQAIQAALQSGHWIRSHEGRAAQGLESLYAMDASKSPELGGGGRGGGVESMSRRGRQPREREPRTQDQIRGTLGTRYGSPSGKRAG